MQESGEMYLETILILSEKLESVRSVDVAEYMSFSKPSVSRAVNKLKDGGYILTDVAGSITLTKNGRSIAESIYERHKVLTEFLMRFGVGKEIAASDACKMEHDISDETFAALKKYISK